MLKLLLCIVCGLAMAVAVLQLRQQKMELLHQCSVLHSDIEDTQLNLWNQQLRIASSTAPLAIRQTMQSYKLALVPSNSDVPQVEAAAVKKNDAH